MGLLQSCNSPMFYVAAFKAEMNVREYGPAFKTLRSCHSVAAETAPDKPE